MVLNHYIVPPKFIQHVYQLLHNNWENKQKQAWPTSPANKWAHFQNKDISYILSVMKLTTRAISLNTTVILVIV